MSAPSVNIASHLPAMARRQPHRQAVVFPHDRDDNNRVSYTHLTFQQLDDESDRIAAGLIDYGITRGMRTVLMVSPSLDFFALTFALFKIGAVPVLVDPGMGVRNLGKCLAEAQPEAFIGIPKAHIARLLFRWSRDTLNHLITVGPNPFWGGQTLDTIRTQVPKDHGFEMTDTEAEEVAAILFTSGSTGIPKGVVYTHGIFDDQVKKLKAVYDIQPGETDLPTFPLFALFAPALGMTAIIPDMDFTRPAEADPSKIAEAIEDFGVTQMFGSPALINRVGRFGVKHGFRFPTLKRVISAGAPVPSAVLGRFSKLIPEDTQIFTPYGATESLPVASIGSHEILRDTTEQTNRGAGVCVGQPVDGINLKIIEITDDPIAEWSADLELPIGEIGEITVQGTNVTREYFNRESSTKLAKIADRKNDSFYHRMGDVGYRDEQGRVWMCGRKTHRVITPDTTLFTIPCEGIFNTHPKVFRSALVGVKKQPVLCVELEADAQYDDKAKIKQELLKIGSNHELTKSIKRIHFHPAFPVDIRHNAKIFREKLALWVAGQ